MIDLQFHVVKAEAEAFAIAPTLTFSLEVRQNSPKAAPIHSAVLGRYKSRHGLPTWEQAIESLLNQQASATPVALGEMS